MKAQKALKAAAVLLSGLLLMTACMTNPNKQPLKKGEAAQPAPQKLGGTMILATTTSTEQTGLLAAILPKFTEQTGIEVKVVAVGTGQAIEMGKNGEADALLVHAKASEEAFVREGYGLERFDVMYNDFVLVGPQADPAGLKQNFSQDIDGAFQRIYEGKFEFVSRGDDSGTHKKELSLWKALALEPSGDWYISVGKGMGETLGMADEMGAYTLSDRGTYLSMQSEMELEILVEKSENLLNQYGVIAIDPAKYPDVKREAAQAFITWILSKDTQKMIGEFGVEKFGQPLFVPNAK